MRNLSTSSGHSHWPGGQRHRLASTTASSSTSAAGDGKFNLSDGENCVLYLVAVIICTAFIFIPLELGSYIEYNCNLELFIDSIAVSSTAAPAVPAEWNVRLLVKSPVTGCGVSLNMLYARLLRGEKILSKIDSFRVESVGENPAATAAFNTTTLEGVRNSVVWDFAVEAFAGVQVGTRSLGRGYINMTCGELPVRFWSDPATAAVKGSLLGRMRQCDYTFHG